MTIRLQMFDARQTWTTYTGQVWPKDEKARAIHDAREFFGKRPEIFPGGVRLIDVAGRVLWSIGAKQTFRLVIAENCSERTLWRQWGLSLPEAERERTRHSKMFGAPVHIVPEEYPRESAPVEPIKPPAFSSPKVQPASTQAGGSVPPVIFQFGEESAA